LQPPDYVSVLSVVRTNSTTATVTFDRDVTAFSGGTWGLQIKIGTTWTTGTLLANPTARTVTIQFAGADPAVGLPWRIDSLNTALSWGTSTPSIPCAGLVQ